MLRFRVAVSTFRDNSANNLERRGFIIWRVRSSIMNASRTDRICHFEFMGHSGGGRRDNDVMIRSGGGLDFIKDICRLGSRIGKIIDN